MTDQFDKVEDSTVYKEVDQNIDTTLAALAAMANELEEYILASEVYRTIWVNTTNGRYRLTMSGGILLTQIETLQAIRESLSGEQRDQLNTIVTQVETTKVGLQTPFHSLLRRELMSRLATNKWSNDEIVQEERDERSPAENDNILHIALIRQELAEAEIPQEAADPLDQLEQSLEKALEQLTATQEHRL